MINPGTLFVVATPIGNLGDFSQRAGEVLSNVDVIAAEDTRHTRKLLNQLKIETPLISYHDYSNASKASNLLRRIKKGQSVALVSDAGTPLISDPGYRLVRRARESGVTVTPIPGASALIAALSVAGLPTDSFVFEGFLPAKASARNKRLKELAFEPRTLVFYESPHRVVKTTTALKEFLGKERQIFIGRELTKRFESHFFGEIQNGLRWLEEDSDQQKGEFVIVVNGCRLDQFDKHEEKKALDLIEILRKDLSLNRAVSIASNIFNARKNKLYQLALNGEAEE
ncbi:MAG: 16S rRNA (cytidine(1402)-2'-O)-methyltransferase [Gammaproteobacteria bacterium]|jgi:16S rRNA (cytidine1402-2'-O)-methyltransferase|nr:16S rRNA (cytidine(1402)-2'-O)-methyltransferase [Gammaproteobacteria bacterium]MCH2577011.1 16S rRNA (cytidine(1402)-2'-O)-methyltransferase [Pseudomonadales bacterium]MEC8949459.1 16S rRNA (cytidine(1402)-2'-O)-methyltransferase [Pseudomonadota bacterium]MBI91520.1 16S rRNA (cytidine(1402)-2'-O)-methyltransferase [Gammaproteobacteria bacterium]MEC9218525.1 16S rRNA (cytidine(1402)-2'-O)-methyltransferase [Pseudomonadota bacterium]|tara:strand:- start:2905 stop:3756 length:852 start_codon:yes stop_codon:yes gene_type:complete